MLVKIGFGHDIAKRLDDLGLIVFAGCLYKDGQGASTLRQTCSERLHVLSLDVGSEKSVNSCLSYIRNHLPSGGLRGVVNNAGFNVMGDVEFLTVNLYHKAMNVNFYGTLRVAKAFLPFLRQSGGSSSGPLGSVGSYQICQHLSYCESAPQPIKMGRMINMSSGRGRVSLPGDSPYHVSKHCIEMMSDCLRLEMKKFGVKVSVIEPGNYASTTACQDTANFKRYRSEADEMWNCAANSVKEAYGRHYLDAMLTRQQKHSCEGSAPTTGPVIQAIVDALLSSTPLSRYLVDGSSGWFDKTPMLVRVSPFLPDAVTDYIVKLWMEYDKVPSPTVS